MVSDTFLIVQAVIPTRKTTKLRDSSTAYGTFDKILVFERSSDHEKMSCQYVI